VLSLVALAALATPVHGEDDFPLVGTYTENQACKTDGSDPGVSRVKITPHDIDSVFGLCTILSGSARAPPLWSMSSARARAAARC
jgi:hypothetical protein